MQLFETELEEKMAMSDFIVSYETLHQRTRERLKFLYLNLDFITVETARKELQDILEEEDELNI